MNTYIQLGGFILYYVYFAYGFYTIFKKLNVSNPWLSFIPLISVFPTLKAARKPLWWILLLFIPFVNFIIAIVILTEIAHNMGKSKWHGLGLMIPIVQLFSLGIIAFSSNETKKS